MLISHTLRIGVESALVETQDEEVEARGVGERSVYSENVSVFILNARITLISTPSLLPTCTDLRLSDDKQQSSPLEQGKTLAIDHWE
jgi:hypothetical protein